MTVQPGASSGDAGIVSCAYHHSVRPRPRPRPRPRIQVARRIIAALRGCRAPFVVIGFLSRIVLPTASAQFPGELSGRIVGATTGEPIENVLVEVLGTDLTAVSDGRGEFRIHGLEPEGYTVRLSRLGYRSVLRQIDVRNGRRATLAVQLAPRPLPVAEVRAQADRIDAPGSIFISRAQIERSSAQTAAEVLEGRAGLVVVRRGPTGPQMVSIRGSAADQVLVLLDGAPLGSPVTGAADLSAIPASQIESITVLKGSQSARYGPGAEAGAILIETRMTAAPLGLRAGAGSLGLWNGAAEASGGSADFSWSAGGQLRTVDGGFQYEQPDALGGGTSTRANNDLHEGSGFLTASAPLAEGRGRLRIGHTRLERGLPGRSFAPTPSAHEELTRWNGQAAWERAWTRSRVSAQFHGATQRARFFDRDPPIGLPYDSETDALTLGGRVTSEISIASPLQSLAGGLEVRQQSYESTTFDESAPSGRFDFGAFIGGELSGTQLFGGTPRLVAGLRIDRDGLDHVWRVTHELTARFSTGPAGFYIRHASSYRPPTFGDQFFRAGVAVEPNPALRAERVPNDFGVGGRVEERIGDAAVGRLAIDGYMADVKGMIIWAPDFRFVWSPRNFDVKRRGLDAEAALLFIRHGLEIRGSYSYTRATYDRPEGDDDVQVIYRTRHTGSVAARWRPVRWELGADVRYTGTRYPFPAPVNALDPFWTVDLRLRRTFDVGAWRLTPLLAVDRVLDNEDSLIFGYPEPGRTFRFELETGPR